MRELNEISVNIKDHIKIAQLILVLAPTRFFSYRWESEEGSDRAKLSIQCVWDFLLWNMLLSHEQWEEFRNLLEVNRCIGRFFFY